MASVTQTFEDRWRSRNHVGEAKPEMRVYVRRGTFLRRYDTWDGDDIKATIPKTSKKPWQAFWTPSEDYVEIPGVLESRMEQDFEENGITRLGLDVENIIYKQETGLAGLFRTIQRGYLSPWRGFQAPGRPGIAQEANEWYQALNRNAQIRIDQGLGDQMSTVFTGLIDDLDLTAKPDRIVVTGRDFGQVLTDQKLFGHVKDKALLDPITFADRHWADEKRRVGGGAAASSSRPEHPPRFAVDTETSTYWASDGHSTRNVTEWHEVRVPRGRYEDFYLEPQYEGMEMFVSVYAKTDRLGRSYERLANGTKRHLNPGWIDVGKGDVPGGNGGFPYLAHKGNITKRGRYYRLDHSFELADDSIIRIGFRNLGRAGDGEYHAGIKTFAPIRRRQRTEVAERRWILVDDPADIVRVILRWAGFKEWDVEDTGARLKDKLVFNRGTSMMEAIRKVAEITNYVFYMADPSNSSSSIGVPTFRATRAVQTQPGVKQVTDKNFLTGIQAKITEEPLPYNIRVRGAVVSKGVPGTRTLGRDTTNRWHAHYDPPWQSRMGGVVKHIVHYDPGLKSQEECEIAARYIALQAALKSATAVIQIPGHPVFQLDQQVSVVDTATGLNTRLWIASRSSTFTRGEKAKWAMSLGGGLVDTPDVVDVVEDINSVQFPEDAGTPVVTGGARQP